MNCMTWKAIKFLKDQRKDIALPGQGSVYFVLLNKEDLFGPVIARYKV